MNATPLGLDRQPRSKKSDTAMRCPFNPRGSSSALPSTREPSPHRATPCRRPEHVPKLVAHAANGMTASASLLARSCSETKREQQLAVSLGSGDGIAEPGNGPCTYRQ